MSTDELHEPKPKIGRYITFDELEDIFWDDELVKDSNQSLRDSIKSDIREAKRTSSNLANKIENYNENRNKTQEYLFWILLVLALSAVSFITWILVQHNRTAQLRRETAYTIKNDDYMPSFLDIPGTGSSFIPSILSSCLGLEGVKLIDGAENVSSCYCCNSCQV